MTASVKPNRRAHGRGLSLVEILVAVALLAIVIAVLTPVFTGGFGGVFTSARKTDALFEAQTQIENVIPAQAADSGLLTLDFEGTAIGIAGEEREETIEYEDGRIVTIKYFDPAR